MDTKLPAKALHPLHLSDVTPTGASLGYHHSAQPPDGAGLIAVLFIVAIPMIVFSVIRRLIQRAFGISKSRARAATLLLFILGGMSK